MHGPKRTPVWTVMEETANIGDSTIKLSEAVDWKVGEQIAIAPTGFDPHAADKRSIKAIDDTDPAKPVITLDKPLEHKHYAAIETYGNETIDMRAEVALLSRNVVFRGDVETSADNKYGATIFLHS